MGSPPLPLGVINALLLLCAWPFTTIRFLRDPSLIFSSIAMSSCFLLGLHTGRGEHPELVNSNFQMRNTDEEATYTWAGFNIISQRCAERTNASCHLDSPLTRQQCRLVRRLPLDWPVL